MFIYEKNYDAGVDSEGNILEFEAINFLFGKGNQLPVTGVDSEGNPKLADVVIYKEMVQDSEGEYTIPGPTHMLVNGKEVEIQ